MGYRLDAKDRMILYELDSDARQSYSSLAKRVGLSKDAVSYRMKTLEDAGVIRNYIAVLDIGRLGYMTPGAFLKLHETTPGIEEEIFSYLQKHPKVAWFVSCEGSWDMNTMLWVRSIYEYEDFWKGFTGRFRQYIASNWFNIITRLHHFPRDYLLKGTNRKPKKSRPLVIGEAGEAVKVDALDLRILRLLAPNARMSLMGMARKLGSSPKVIAYRIRKLERDKVILGYRLGMNLDRIGIVYYKLHLYLRNMTHKKEKEMFEYARMHPNIIYIDEKIGGADMEFELQVESQTQFREILSEIRHRFSDVVNDYDFLVYYKEHKLVYLPEE
ncbi:MAG: Lrp/AsnC family transcriptional regulator [Candidatus Micrarchaeota archaeon]